MLKGGRTSKMAEKRKWTDEEVVRLMDLWAEETIQFSLDNVKTPKEKTSVYKTLQIQLEQQGKKRTFIRFSDQTVRLYCLNFKSLYISESWLIYTSKR